MTQSFIPNTSEHDVVSFNISVEGDRINASYQILSITVLKEINRLPSAKIVLRDGDASKQDFEISNTNDFVPGKTIKIDMGRDGTDEQVFKGIIVKHAIKIKENGNTELQIDCRDEVVRMTIGRHSRYYKDMKDSEIFDQLIGNYKGLTSDAEVTNLSHKELVQHHISDWDFMLLRAEANAALVMVNDGKVTICKLKTNGAPVLDVQYGSSILELEAEMDMRSQWPMVVATSWDYKGQQLFSAETNTVSNFTELGNISGNTLSDSNIAGPYQMHHSGHLQEQELQSWADGLMLRSRLSKIRGSAKFAGFAAIKPGDIVTLGGLGDRFNGSTPVTAVCQEIVGGSWDTRIQFGLDAGRYAFVYNDLHDAPAGGLVGAVNGLQIGIVTELENDPDEQDRIKVRIPVINNNEDGIWMRLACMDAGKDRGCFFRPEIDDEVIVGFINDDPREAVVLGMLNSSAKPAPLRAQNANHEKGITTRSKMHIHFNDETKTITIDTPAGNKITLDESGKQIQIMDQNSNKITMLPDGIKLESMKEIMIKAGTALTIEAETTMSLKAPNISVKADAEIKLEGTTAKLASQGPNVISGLPVKIN
jgi:Rhs element Vgr protein